MNDPISRRSCFARPTISPGSEFVAFPFNLHLLHDIGAFQIGIGAALLLGLRWSDAVMVALGGYVVGTAVHVVSHIIDSHLGGHGTDAPALALLVVIGVAAMIARARET